MKNENCLSIITNFGCHYTCPYCIVKNNNLHIPTTTIKGLSKLRQIIIDNNINMVSISGGGDPCYKFNLHYNWYTKLAEIMKEFDISLELHTSYIYVNGFPYDLFSRIVYHVINLDHIRWIKKRGEQEIRIVFVVTKDFTEDKVFDIVNEINKHPEHLELSFRQMVDSSYNTTDYLYAFLKTGHKKLWWYIEQNDYNLYYAENETSYKYEDFKLLK